MSPTYADPVLVERMPEHLRDSHRAAGNWGSYPANGAERVIVERADTEKWVYDAEADAHSNIEADEYDHIVRDATPADFDHYAVETERVENIGGEVARTAEAWWAWHDRDQARWSQTIEEAESRCALWVAGDSDDGPA